MGAVLSCLGISDEAFTGTSEYRQLLASSTRPLGLYHDSSDEKVPTFTVLVTGMGVSESR